MKTLAISLGLLIASVAGAAPIDSAELIGRTVNTAFADGPILICEYVASGTRYEIVAPSGHCATSLQSTPAVESKQQLAALVPDRK